MYGNNYYNSKNKVKLHVQNHVHKALTWEETAESWGWPVSQQTSPLMTVLSKDPHHLLEMWTQVEKSDGCSLD